jgi:hypothetical protein
MAIINPISRLYDDMTIILESMTIKYSYRADENETVDIANASRQYMCAYDHSDSFLTYTDYTASDFLAVDSSLEESVINAYLYDLNSVPDTMQNKLLINKRKSIISNYDELNDYYRMLHGLPNVDETISLFKVYDYAPDTCNTLGIPKDMYVHEVEDKLGFYYISSLENLGIIDEIISKNKNDSSSEYLQHIGTKRIDLYNARIAKNFEILYLDNNSIMESTYREFILLYNQCRTYFMTTMYVYEYRSIIPRYDNFIALCIFIMTMQQLSVRSIKNSTDREFYDNKAIQLLYETYGLPFNGKIDELTQKQIVQNVNLLIQNKASSKVILDIASILGFNNIEIYEYYLMKERLFDSNGRPIFKTKSVIDSTTGKYKTVYDYESMYDVFFQRIPIGKEDIHEALHNELNKINYDDIVYYDPFWWEDDELKSEIYEKEYNIMETKYLGMTIPYRLTEMIFQSVYLLRMIEDKKDDLNDITINIPKISSNSVKIVDIIILLSALLAKKYSISGLIYTMPSQLLHIVEVLDQEINKDFGYNEVLGFDFDMFKLEPNEIAYKDDINKVIWRKNAAYCWKTVDNKSKPVTDDKWHMFNLNMEEIICSPMTDDEIKEKVNSGKLTLINLSSIDKTNAILQNYLKKRDYIVLNHHDVDVDRKTGVQNKFSPTHLVDYDINDTDYKEFLGYIQTLSQPSLGTDADTKRKSLNAMFKDMKKLYHFLSYRMSVTQDLKEYYAIKKFYEAAFYSTNISDMFDVPTSYTSDTPKNYTYMDYLKEHNLELYQFVENVDKTQIYLYIEHIIYCLETFLDNIDYLYLMNDEVSPLQDLLLQLVNFFRSFTTDMIDFSSIMLVDWRMENMLKLIDCTKSITKTDMMKDEIFGTGYGDFIKKFTVRYWLQESLKYNDECSISSSEMVDDSFILDDRGLQYILLNPSSYNYYIYEPDEKYHEFTLLHKRTGKTLSLDEMNKLIKSTDIRKLIINESNGRKHYMSKTDIMKDDITLTTNINRYFSNIIMRDTFGFNDKIRIIRN